MGLDNYWHFDIDDLTGLERGDTFEFEPPNADMDGVPETDTYTVDEDQDSVMAFYAAMADCPEHPEFDRDIQLVGGIVSGNGPYSFRGKVYDGFVEKYTGVSLYQQRIDNDTVVEMADALDDLEWLDITMYHGGYDGFRDEQQFEDFRTMFREYADAGAWLHGWW